MLKTVASPRTLHEAIRYFQDPDRALAFVVQLRWPNGVICPACEAPNASFFKSRRIWKCRDCHRQFSAKLGTIFEDSPLGFDKWLPALWMLANCKNGVSSYELGRALGVTQKTAWFMLGRIGRAMRTPGFSRFGGEVEIDETFIDGLAKFMHKGKRSRHARLIKGNRGMVGKVAVAGVLRRGPKGKSKVRAMVAAELNREQANALASAHVIPGAEVFTDASQRYNSNRVEIVAPERNVSVGILRGRHRCEFSHGLRSTHWEGLGARYDVRP